MIPVTVTEHEAFRAEFGNTADDLAIDPGDFNPPARLKERELHRVLSILDDIEKEGGPA